MGSQGSDFDTFSLGRACGGEIFFRRPEPMRHIGSGHRKSVLCKRIRGRRCLRGGRGSPRGALCGGSTGGGGGGNRSPKSEGGLAQTDDRMSPHKARSCTRICATGVVGRGGVGFCGPGRLRPPIFARFRALLCRIRPEVGRSPLRTSGISVQPSPRRPHKDWPPAHVPKAALRSQRRLNP